MYCTVHLSSILLGMSLIFWRLAAYHVNFMDYTSHIIVWNFFRLENMPSDSLSVDISGGLLGWGLRGSHQIIYVRIFPNICSTFATANRPNTRDLEEANRPNIEYSHPGSNLARFRNWSRFLALLPPYSLTSCHQYHYRQTSTLRAIDFQLQIQNFGASGKKVVSERALKRNVQEK